MFLIAGSHCVAAVNCTDDYKGSRCEVSPCTAPNKCPTGVTCTENGGKAECGPCPSGSEYDPSGTKCLGKPCAYLPVSK